MPHPLISRGFGRLDKGKVVSAAEAVRLIRSGDTIATGGFVGIGFAENVAVALEARWLDSQRHAPDGIGVQWPAPDSLVLALPGYTQRFAAAETDRKRRAVRRALR